MAAPLRVLIVEDSEDDTLLLVEALREGGFMPSYRRVETEAVYRAALTGESWDVMLADFILPHFSGIAAIHIARESGIDLPVIMVSGKAGEETAVEAMRAGAQDYLLKGHLARLVPAITRELQEVQVRRERRIAEEALRESEARFRNLFDEVAQRAAELDAIIASIASGLIVNAPDGRITTANPAAEVLLGTSPEAWGLPLLERWQDRQLFLPDGREMALEEFPPLRALRGDIIRDQVLRIHIPDRPDNWLSLSAAPIRTPDGQLRGAVTIFADVTQLHQLQEQREDFIRTVSHDLRAPMTIIYGHAELLDELLTEHPHSELEIDCVKAISRGIQRMNVMIQDLVDAARMEGGQLVLNLRAVSLSAFIADLMKRAGAVLDTSRIHSEFSAGLPRVCADYDRLERIFVNLLTNAMKYSAPDTPICISAGLQADQVLVRVTDQGQGIPAEDLPRLFERFYRAKATRKIEGLGLGLYITHMLVAAHNGQIWVESEVGNGSTFSFTLPVAQAETCPSE